MNAVRTILIISFYNEGISVVGTAFMLSVELAES